MKLGGALVFTNGRAGWKMAEHLMLQSVHPLLDKGGIVNDIHRIPPKDTSKVLSRSDPSKWDCVVVAAGDGTVSSIAQQMQSRPGWGSKPILIIPCGTQNSIAHAVGIHDPMLAVSAFSSRNITTTKMWEITLHDEETGESLQAPMRGDEAVDRTFGFIAGVNFGAFSNVVRDSRQLQLWTTQMMSLPQLKRKYFWVSLYNLLFKYETVEAVLTMTVVKKDGTTEEVCLKKPLRLCNVSRVPYQHSNFSLTPAARLGRSTLEVTIATEDAERFRMLHLFMRESVDGRILREDGVDQYTVTKLKISACKEPFHILIDGETFVCTPGISLTLTPSEREVSFFSVD